MVHSSILNPSGVWCFNSVSLKFGKKGIGGSLIDQYQPIKSMSEKETGKTLGTKKPVSEWEKGDVLIWVRDTLKNNENYRSISSEPYFWKGFIPHET
jgi:hypothetical protein